MRSCFTEFAEDGSGDQMPWSRVARRRTDLVPTIPASRDNASRGSSTPRPPGRAYSMSRLDQLAQPRRPRPLAPPPPPPQNQLSPPTRPPRHRSMGNLAVAVSHRSTSNLASIGPSPPPRKHSKAVPQPQGQLDFQNITILSLKHQHYHMFYLPLLYISNSLKCYAFLPYVFIYNIIKTCNVSSLEHVIIVQDINIISLGDGYSVL